MKKEELEELINLMYNGHISQYGKRKLETYINKLQKENKKIKKDYMKLQAFYFKDYIRKDKIREFIEKELPDDEIMECCETYDVNGIRLRKELEEIIKGE